MKRILSVILLSMLMGGCSNLCNCKDEQKKVRKKYGDPEEITTYRTNDYNDYKSDSWYYYSRGRSYTFTWGAGECDCDKVTHTFERTEKIVSDDDRRNIQSNKKLIRQETIRQDEDCIVCP